MNEVPNLRWFEETDRKCGCGKRATGILRGDRNESYGPHCKACATRRLKNSERERQRLAALTALKGSGNG